MNKQVLEIVLCQLTEPSSSLGHFSILIYHSALQLSSSYENHRPLSDSSYVHLDVLVQQDRMGNSSSIPVQLQHLVQTLTDSKSPFVYHKV